MRPRQKKKTGTTAHRSPPGDAPPCTDTGCLPVPAAFRPFRAKEGGVWRAAKRAQPARLSSGGRFSRPRYREQKRKLVSLLNRGGDTPRPGATEGLEGVLGASARDSPPEPPHRSSRRLAHLLASKSKVPAAVPQRCAPPPKKLESLFSPIFLLLLLVGAPVSFARRSCASGRSTCLPAPSGHDLNSLACASPPPFFCYSARVRYVCFIFSFFPSTRWGGGTQKTPLKKREVCTLAPLWWCS